MKMTSKCGRRAIGRDAVHCLLGATAVLALTGCDGSPPAERAPAQFATVTAVASSEVAPQPRDYSLILQQLYISYFGRAADPAGLDYYAKHLAANKAPTHIDSYDEAYATNPVVRELMNAFGNSTESKSLYPGDTTVFVTAIYRNVLNREPDSAGLGFWVNAINSGALSKGNAALSLMASALSGGTQDAVLVRNKVAAGSAFTSALNTAEKSAAYSGDAAAEQVRAMLKTVTAASDATAIQVHNHALLAKLISAKKGVRVFHGTVATGNPVKDALVEVFDQNGTLGKALTDINGNYLLVSKPINELIPPFVVKAEFEVLGHQVDLFSIENAGPGLDMELNVTPVTDMITRSYSTSQGKDPLDALQDSSPNLTTIKNIARGIFGPLLPGSAGDPVRERLVPNPQASEWDALLERIKIDIKEEQEAAVIKDTNDRVMATVPLSSLADPSFVPSDATSVTATEATAAIAASGGLASKTQPRVNQVAGALAAPSGLRVSQTGPLTFKLTWDSVADADRYHIYEQVDSPPTISAGTYAAADAVPSYATGGNTEHDLELEYRVPASGTYYWVVAAVAKDGSFTHYTLGTTSEAVSLTFDSSKDVKCETTPLSSGTRYRCFYDTGTPPATRRYQHGTYRVTGSDGKVTLEGEYTDGVESGVWKYYSSANGTYYLREEVRYSSPGKKESEATYDGDHGGEWNTITTYLYRSGATSPDVYVKSTCGNYAPYAARYGTVFTSYRKGSLLNRLDEYKLSCPSGYVGGTNYGLDCCRSTP